MSDPNVKWVWSMVQEIVQMVENYFDIFVWIHKQVDGNKTVLASYQVAEEDIVSCSQIALCLK